MKYIRFGVSGKMNKCHRRKCPQETEITKMTNVRKMMVAELRKQKNVNGAKICWVLIRYPREGGEAEGAPCIPGMDPGMGAPATHSLTTQTLGIAPGLSKLGQTPSYRVQNIQPAPAGIICHVFKAVARVCEFSLLILRCPRTH